MDTFQNSSTSGKYVIDVDGNNYAIGGIVGMNYNYALIKNCHSNIDIKFKGYPKQFGGLAEMNYGTIENSSFKGNVSGTINFAGIVGLND